MQAVYDAGLVCVKRILFEDSNRQHQRGKDFEQIYEFEYD